MINLSVNPTYKCNLRCNFCYLGDKLSDPTYISLNDLENKYKEVTKHFGGIDQVDLYGGEFSLLSYDYQTMLLEITKKYAKGNINIITNLVQISPSFFDEDINLAVSYDFHARFGFEKVYENMAKMFRPFSVLLLASEKVLELDALNIVESLNKLPLITSLEIKPYSKNKYNQQDVSFKDFEDFVKKLIDLQDKMKFDFVNKTKIETSLNKKYNAFSDDHIYITPYNKYAVLEFDENDYEYFEEMDTLQQYEEWVQKEKDRVNKNPVCSKCPYLGNCLTEHYRDVIDLNNSCNGFKNLLDWCKNEKMEV